eukprot:PhM_4_TR4294/c0_g1_i1/m.41109
MFRTLLRRKIAFWSCAIPAANIAMITSSLTVMSPTDDELDKRIETDTSLPYSQQPSILWRLIGLGSTYTSVSSYEKRAFYNTVLGVLKTKEDPATWAGLHPRAEWEDTFMALRYRCEISDGWAFLRTLVKCERIEVDHLWKRWQDGSINALVYPTYRVLFLPAFVMPYVPDITFPLMVNTRFDESSKKRGGGRGLLVDRVQVHWGCAPLLTSDGPDAVPMWGAVGYLLRRWNGIVLSTALDVRKRAKKEFNEMIKT